MNLDEIKSTNKLICVRCEEIITIDSWSGWEAFLPDGKTTQAICKFCCVVDDCCNEKSEG